MKKITKLEEANQLIDFLTSRLSECKEYSTDRWNTVDVLLAKYGREEDLDRLRDTDNFYIKLAIVGHARPKDLNKFINDDAALIRAEIAHVGRPKDLDILVHDPDYAVLKEVAKRGRNQDLEILVNDIHPDVRLEVARQGYGLDKLISDYNSDVSRAANEKLGELGYVGIDAVKEWKKDNPEKSCFSSIDKQSYSPITNARSVSSNKNYDLHLARSSEER